MGITAPLIVQRRRLMPRHHQATHKTTLHGGTLLVQAQAKLGIGYGAYYWLSDSGLGGSYVGESFLSSGYTPNTMGQDYINIYTAPTTTPTPTSTPTPTPAQRYHPLQYQQLHQPR